MGKRELLLIVTFLVLGGIVYQVSAPDHPADREGRSVMDFFRRVRGEMVGSRARFPVDLPVKASVGDDVATLDLGELAGRVEILGEDREDIEGAAVATLLGENETDVKSAAQALKLDIETDGDTLRVRVSHPDAWRLGRHLARGGRSPSVVTTRGVAWRHGRRGRAGRGGRHVERRTRERHAAEHRRRSAGRSA